MPDPHLTGRSPWWAPLLDARTGIIRRLDHEPNPASFPPSFRLVSAVLADASRWSPWPVDSCGAGYAIGNQPSPEPAAAGEALERYCGNIVTGTRHTSYDELTAAGSHAVDPADLALFTADQHARPGFPFTPFERDLVTDWAEGHELVSGRPVLVPASLVWASYPVVAADHGRPVTNPVHQPGLAAGADAAAAVRSALLEIVERDTMVLAWHGGLPLAPVVPPPWLARLGGHPRRPFTTRYLSFPNRFGVEVAAALVHDRANGYLTLGLAARPDLVGALLKALGEAFQLQRFVAGLDDPTGAYVTRIGPTSPLRPWRRDRRYLDDHAEDLRDATDDSCHLQLYLDARMQARFGDELAAALTAAPVDATNLAPPATTPATATAADVDRLVAAITAETGHPPVVVDVTTPDVAASGTTARVVRVVAPGTYANSSAAYPFLGGTRLAATADRTGRRRHLPLPH